MSLVTIFILIGIGNFCGHILTCPACQIEIQCLAKWSVEIFYLIFGWPFHFYRLIQKAKKDDN